MKTQQSSITFSLLVSATIFALPAWGHGGEDHGSKVAPALVTSVTPRATAETEEFELVASLNGKQLTIYLDRFATNEPVADAQIEVESGTLKAVAIQIAPGVYSLPGKIFTSPGKYPLAISVQAGESSDLLSATLDIAKPVARIEPIQSWNKWLVGGAAGALLLAVAGLIAGRRRNKN